MLHRPKSMWNTLNYITDNDDTDSTNLVKYAYFTFNITQYNTIYCNTVVKYNTTQLLTTLIYHNHSQT